MHYGYYATDCGLAEIANQAEIDILRLDEEMRSVRDNAHVLRRVAFMASELKHRLLERAAEQHEHKPAYFWLGAEADND